jgi:Tfp pilus assembly protein PilF
LPAVGAEARARRVPRGARRIWIGLGLVAATLAVYAPVRHHDFVDLDDPQYVVESPVVHEGLSADGIRRAFREPQHFNWAPLTTLSYQAGFALHGLDPAGYLLENVALHALGALLLFLFLERTTGASGRSAFVAAVFALHPLHVESVAWVSSRKDVLSGVFWMLALLAWVRYAERPGVARYALVAALLALGLMAKQTLVTLPIVLLLLDVWPLGRWRRGTALPLLKEKLPLLALSAAAAGIAYAVQHATRAMPELAPPLEVRLANAVHAGVVYLRQSLWPTGLACFYPYPGPGHAPGAWQIAAEATFLLGITAGTLALVRRHPYLAVGWLWYGVTLLPVLGLVQTGLQSRADRYTYLPQIGLAIAVAWGAAAALGARRRALGFVAAAAAGALAVTSALQVRHWRDSRALYTRAVQVTEGNFLAHKGLGAALWRAGRTDAALAHFRESIRLKSNWSPSRRDLGALLLALDRPGEALAETERALAIDPDDLRAQGVRGVALVRLGRYEEARVQLERTVAEGPPNAELLAHLALAQLQTGRRTESVASGERALALAQGTGDAELAGQVRRLLSAARADAPR